MKMKVVALIAIWLLTGAIWACYGLCQEGDLLEQAFCSLWLCLLIGLAAQLCVRPGLFRGGQRRSYVLEV
jgi:hypothetical protein